MSYKKEFRISRELHNRRLNQVSKDIILNFLSDLPLHELQNLVDIKVLDPKDDKLRNEVYNDNTFNRPLAAKLNDLEVLNELEYQIKLKEL